MRKTIFLLFGVVLSVCAISTPAQVVGIIPFPQATYYWNATTSAWVACPNTSTLAPSQNTPIAIVQYGLNSSLNRWTPFTGCPFGGGQLNGTSASFSGTVDSAGGTLTGQLNGTSASFSGTVNSAGGTLTGQLNGTSFISKNAPFVCAESYLNPADGHSGTDYGYALNAADQASPLGTATTIKICQPGDHPVYAPIIFDRPIDFVGSGSRLIVQSSLGSTPITLTGATITAGSQTVSVSSTSGLAAGQAIGGRGLLSGSYITAVGSGNITISLPPRIVFMALATQGSTTVRITGSMAGLVSGMTVTGYGIQTGTTIGSLNTVTQTGVLSLAPTATSLNNVNIQQPISLLVTAGSWTANLTAVTVKNVITWPFNSSALTNEFGQNIGGAMTDVWIVDTGTRAIQGVNGVQIWGWDRFYSKNLNVELLNGSGLILGGYNVAVPTRGTTRESHFYNTIVRNSGNELTGQSAILLMTAAESPFFDELNGLGFIGGEVISNNGESITIGSYYSGDFGVQGNGPREIFFSGDFHVETGNYIASFPFASTQFDSIGIQQSDDVHFTNGEFLGSGYGKAIFRCDYCGSLAVTDNFISSGSLSPTYVVGVTNGSKTVTYVSGGNGVFQTDHTWDGVAGISVDGGTCTTGSPCSVYLDPANGVPTATSLQLSSNYAGTTNAAASLTIPISGFIANFVGTPSSNVDFIGNFNFGQNSTYLVPIGLGTYDQTYFVGSGVQGFPYGIRQSFFSETISNFTAQNPVSRAQNGAYASGSFYDELSVTEGVIDSIPNGSSPVAAWPQSSVVLEGVSAGGEVLSTSANTPIRMTPNRTDVLDVSAAGVVINTESGQAGFAACFTTGGKIGHCTTVVGSSGGCTCVSP